MIAQGTTISQNRLRRTFRMSSGLYTLPGSIGTPYLRHQRRPEIQRQSNALSLHCALDAGGHPAVDVKVIAIDRILQAEPQHPREAPPKTSARMRRLEIRGAGQHADVPLRPAGARAD